MSDDELFLDNEEGLENEDQPKKNRYNDAFYNDDDEDEVNEDSDDLDDEFDTYQADEEEEEMDDAGNIN